MSGDDRSNGAAPKRLQRVMVMKKPCPACGELVRAEALRCQFCMTNIPHGAPVRWRAAVLACAVVIAAAATVLALVG